MNIISAIASARNLFKQGAALKGSGFLANTEAMAAALYGVISALIMLLNDLGLEVHVGATDMHTMANGWTITASFAYSLYRLATNASAGFGRVQQ